MYPTRFTRKLLAVVMIAVFLGGALLSLWANNVKPAQASVSGKYSEMLAVSNTAAATTAVDVRVSSGADDVEQRLSDGYMYTNSTDLELVNDPGSAQGMQSVGMRFTGVAIPRGAVITKAYLEFQVDETSSEATSLVLRAEAADNAAVFTTTAKNVTSRAHTAASVSWNSISAWSTLNVKVQTPDLTPVVQEVVSRAGWSSGNSLVLFVDGSGRRVGKAYEIGAATAPLLHVEYAAAVLPSPTSVPTLQPTTAPIGSSSTIIDKRVSSGADDVEQRLSDGYMYTNSTDLELVNDPGSAQGMQSVGMRFTGVAIPRGAVITKAYLEFQVDETSSEATSLVLRAEAADNAAAFTTTAKNVTSRAHTAASVSWNSISAWSTLNVKVQTPDLTPVVQEVVSRAGWSSGNSLVLFVDGSGRRVGKAYEIGAATAPLLHVEFTTTGSVPQPTVAPTAQPTVGPSPTPTTPPPSPTPTATSNGQPLPVGQTGAWKMVFNDEFNGSTLDSSKWRTCFWWADTTCTIESNHEQELYNPGDVLVQNGLLRLRAQKRDMVAWNGVTYNYTSGMVMSGGRSGKIAPGFSFTYGYAEARVKVPAGQGLWPAFWMLPTSYNSRPEIDIMEILGHQPSVYHMNYHYIGGDKGTTWTGPDFSKDFHILGVNWSPSAIVWYVDGVERWRFTDTAYISKEPEYLLLNLAVGGDWPGAPNSTTPFPSFMDVDYVRVWQK